MPAQLPSNPTTTCGSHGTRVFAPLITCLCLTKDRRAWLPQAIACFEAQDYPNKELVIIADGEDVRDLIPPRGGIRFFHDSGTSSVGDKCNFGCELAHGSLIAMWDDDDWSAPGRLSDQVQRLQSNGKHTVTGYHAMRFTDGERWWMRRVAPQFAVFGTSLFFRRDWWMEHPFEDVNNGYDSAFAGDAYVEGRLLTADAGDLMFARIHGGNSTPYSMGGHGWAPEQAEP